ncbi:MAG: methionine--tRNA ligase, partial [bacterium]
MSKFYVTTPIYYANALVHLGHAYSSTASDVLARWHRLRGDETFFLTGTDEHGGNVEKVAREHGVEPQAWVDRIAAEDQALFREIGISNDDFIRTTEARHRRACDAFWRAVAAGKAPDGGPNIRKGAYEGLYCRPCEAYYAEPDLINGLCPIHKTPVETVKEETYFFRLSAWQGKLAELYAGRRAAGRPFVVPDSRANEVEGLMREGLRDVSISRSKLKWGIPVPDDPGHVIYVWFDALINYLTAVGYPDAAAARWKYWPADLHVVGKEIIRFHAILWPAMLMAAGLELPGKIVVHGFLT